MLRREKEREIQGFFHFDNGTIKINLPFLIETHFI